MLRTFILCACALISNAQILAPILYPSGATSVPITFVSGQAVAAQNSAGNSAPQSATFASPATVGNVVFYGASGYLGPATTLFSGTDNRSNTPTQDASHQATVDTNVYASLGHIPITSTGSPYSVTSTPNAGSFSYPGISAIEVSGLASSTPDSTTSNGGSSSTVTCNSITTTASSSLIVVAAESYANTITAGSGLTIPSGGFVSNPGGVAIVIAYAIVTPGTYSLSLNLGSSTPWACAAASYH